METRYTGAVTNARLSFALWLMLLAAFVVLGIRGIAKRFDTRPPKITSQLAGIDQEFLRLLEVRHGSDLMLQIAARIPPNQAVMVFGAGDDAAFSETFMLVSYLFWPRPVWAIGQVESGKVDSFSVKPDHPIKPAAMFLYLVKPPAEFSAHAQPLGPNLSLILTSQNEP